MWGASDSKLSAPLPNPSLDPAAERDRKGLGSARAKSQPARDPWSFSKAGELSCLLNPGTLLSLSVCLSPVWLRAFTSIPPTSASHSAGPTHHVQDSRTFSLLTGKLFALELHVRNAVKQNDLVTGGVDVGLPGLLPRASPSQHEGPLPGCIPVREAHHSQVVYLGRWVCPPGGSGEQRGEKATSPSLGIQPAAPSTSFRPDSKPGLLATPRHAGRRPGGFR